MTPPRDDDNRGRLLVRVVRPLANPMHPLEVGAHLASIIGGAHHAWQIVGKTKRKRQRNGFALRNGAGSELFEARAGTPKLVLEVGGLVELGLSPENLRSRLLRLLGGGPSWKFSPGRTKLVADSNGDLHIVGLYISPPEGIELVRSYFVGEVTSVAYTARDKTYGHKFAEQGGQCPRLFYKNGFLLFRGGTYGVTTQGIVG
jgi:hypothetical protein